MLDWSGSSFINTISRILFHKLHLLRVSHLSKRGMPTAQKAEVEGAKPSSRAATDAGHSALQSSSHDARCHVRRVIVATSITRLLLRASTQATTDSPGLPIQRRPRPALTDDTGAAHTRRLIMCLLSNRT